MRRNGGINLGRYWPFWGLHFGIHILMGVVATIAGIVVIFMKGEIIAGLALLGAGGFALLNGWQGFIELNKSKHRKLRRPLE